MDTPRIPAPEVLIAISGAFQIYMLAGGQLELEDLFFGPAKKGVGNYSARTRKPKSYENFDCFVRNGDLFADIDERKEFSQRSREDKAEEYLLYGLVPNIVKHHGYKPNYGHGVDVDSFLRGYRRWKRTTKE